MISMIDDFSLPTFDERHNLIKGGSWISTGNEATRHARYAFRRHFYQHAGFRYVESNTPIIHQHSDNITEHDTQVCIPLHSQYAENILNIPIFSVQLSNHVIRIIKQQQDDTLFTSLCDLQCGPGRSCFQLLPYFDHIVGLDRTARLIRLAAQLQYTGRIQYCTQTEGELESYHEIDLSGIQSSQTAADHTLLFQQADASNLDPKHTGFTCIIAPNLLETLSSPEDFLSVIHQRLRIGGVLVLSSTYQWDEAITPKHKWLGGNKVNGESVDSFTSIDHILQSHFQLIESPTDLTWVRQQNARSFSVQIAQVSCWKRVR